MLTVNQRDLIAIAKTYFDMEHAYGLTDEDWVPLFKRYRKEVEEQDVQKERDKDREEKR